MRAREFPDCPDQSEFLQSLRLWISGKFIIHPKYIEIFAYLLKLKSLHVTRRHPEILKRRRASYRRLSKAAEGFITEPLGGN